MTKKALTVFALLILAVLISPTAKADTATFSFDLSNVSAANPWTTPPAGGFGTVTLTLVGGNIDVSIQMVANYQLIMDSFGFNWGGSGSAPTINVTNITPGYSLANGGVPQSGPPGMDGFGNFNYQITGPNVGSGNALGSLSFTIVGRYSSVYQFVGENALGIILAAHVYDPNSTAENKTGYVAVPEPGSLTLLLLGAGALLLGGRWKK